MSNPFEPFETDEQRADFVAVFGEDIAQSAEEDAKVERAVVLASLGAGYLDRMTAAYLECAEWSSVDADPSQPAPIDGSDPDPVPLDSLGLEWSTDANNAAREVCESFVATALADLVAVAAMVEQVGRSEYSAAELAGHDLWLTSARHGTGFWDRGYGAAGDRLTKVAHTFPMDVYIGDDRQLHLS
jgi:hypothetical protein